MGNLCSPDKTAVDAQNAPKDTQFNTEMNTVRQSVKRMRRLTDKQILEGFDTEQTNRTFENSPKKPGLMDKIAMVVDPCKEKLNRLEHDLKVRFELIHDLTTSLEVYISVIQHQANNFKAMSSELYQSTIKVDVLKVLQFISEQQYADIEGTINQIKTIQDTLNMNMKNEEAFNQILLPTNNLFDQLDKQIKEMRKMMFEMKKKWFSALDKQHRSDTLQDKIIARMDKVTDVQQELGALIDSISIHIESKEIDDIDGQNNDMMLQKHIVSANSLLDKVDRIKDQMDKGELDGRSNLRSMLESVIDDNPYAFNSRTESASPDVKKESILEAAKSPTASGSRGSFFSGGKKKERKARKTVTDLPNQGATIRTKDMANTFQIQSADGGSDDDKDDKDASNSASDIDIKEKGQDQMNKIAGALVAELQQDENLKIEEKKLLKYNNIYDRLRKKRDQMNTLLVQRKFLAHQKEIKEKCQKQLSHDMILDYICNQNLLQIDIFKMNEFKLKSKGRAVSIDLLAEGEDEGVQNQDIPSKEEVMEMIKKQWETEFDDKLATNIKGIEDAIEKGTQLTSIILQKTTKTKTQGESQSNFEKQLQTFYEGLDQIKAICDHFQDISLFHKIIGAQINEIIGMKPVFDSEMNKIKKMLMNYVTDINAIEIDEDFNSSQYSKAMNLQKKLNMDQAMLKYKIKLKEAELFACIMMQGTLDLTKDDSDQPSLKDLSQSLMKVLKVLLSDQETVQKKWSKILIEKETIEINGMQHKLKLDESIEYMKKIEDIQAKLMGFQDKNPFGTLVQILLKLGFLTKNVQLGKQIFLQQNYAAQRVKKLAHSAQAERNVEIKKGKIQFVKKNYKGNLETLKVHQKIPSYFDTNKAIQFDLTKPAENLLMNVIKKNKDNHLSYLKLEKLDDGQYKIGGEDPLVTEFFILKGQDIAQTTDESNAVNESMQTIQTPEIFGMTGYSHESIDPNSILCFKYGKGVLVFNEDFSIDLALKEVRSRIQKSLLTEQNGLSQQSMEQIQKYFTNCHILTEYIRQ